MIYRDKCLASLIFKLVKVLNDDTNHFKGVILMATRPVFVNKACAPFYRKVDVEFVWSGGFIKTLGLSV